MLFLYLAFLVMSFAMEIAGNIPKKNMDRAIGADKHRFMDHGRCHTETVLKQLREGICDVKMLHQHGGNFLFSLANTQNVRKALLNLEFISAADLFMSSFCEIADVVLPVSHWLEEEDLWDTHPGFTTRALSTEPRVL